MAVNFLNEIESNDDSSGEVMFTDSKLQDITPITSTQDGINQTLLEIFSESQEQIANLAAIFNIVFFIICVLGIVANITSIIIFSRHKLRDSAFNSILIFVCIADTIALSGYFLEQLDYAVKFILNEWTCKATAFVSNSGTMLSSWIVVLMAIERIKHNKQQTENSNIFNRSNIWKCGLILCAIYLATNLHVFWTITADTSVQMTCVYDTVKYYNFWWAWWIFDACIVSLLPFIIIKIVIAKLILCPKTSEGKDTFSTDKDTNNEIALFIFTKFIICVTTAYAFQLYQRIIAENYELLYGIKIMYTADETIYSSKLSTFICYTFLLINHSVKLLLFIILNKDFRVQLKQCIMVKSKDDLIQDDQDFVYLNIAENKPRKGSASTVSSKLSSLLSKYDEQDIIVPPSEQNSEIMSMKSYNTLLNLKIEECLKDRKVLCYDNPIDIIEDGITANTDSSSINPVVTEETKVLVHYGEISHDNTNGNNNNGHNTSNIPASPDVFIDTIEMDVLSNTSAAANEDSLLEQVTRQLFPILSSGNLGTTNNSCC